MDGLAHQAANSFFIRIRNNSYSTNSRGQKTHVDRLFYTLKSGEVERLSQRRPLGQCQVYLSDLRLVDGELLIITSNCPVQDAIKIYGLCAGKLKRFLVA